MFRNFQDSTMLATFWDQTSVSQLEMHFPSRDLTFEYYSALKKLIVQELNATGRCALAEVMLKNCSHWDPTTICAVYDAIDYATFQQTSKSIRNRYNWDKQLDLKRHNERYSLNNADCQEYLKCYRVLQSQWTDQHKNPQSKEADTIQPAKTFFQSFLSGGRSAEQEKSTSAEGLQQQAQDILRKARSEAEEILANAKKEADRARNEAQQQITYKKGEAENEAKLMLKSAQQQAEALKDKAYQDALQEAREELKAKADRDLQKLIQTNLNRYLAEQRNQWDLEHRELETAKTEMSRQTAILKEEACHFANNAGADMSIALADAIETVSQMRTQLLEQLQTWKTSLYRSEYSPLVSCFNTLVILQGRFERDMAAEEAMTEEAVLTKLQQHSQSLSKFRANMERAMNALGLRTFCPTQGELFDAYYHTTDDEENDELYNGHTIRACTSPGIIRTVNSQEEVVLHRAEVVVQIPEDRTASQASQEVSHEQ